MAQYGIIDILPPDIVFARAAELRATGVSIRSDEELRMMLNVSAGVLSFFTHGKEKSTASLRLAAWMQIEANEPAGAPMHEPPPPQGARAILRNYEYGNLERRAVGRLLVILGDIHTVETN